VGSVGYDWLARAMSSVVPGFASNEVGSPRGRRSAFKKDDSRSPRGRRSRVQREPRSNRRESVWREEQVKDILRFVERR
jgi:hypothetical protein